jgi:hypothetical protein
MKTLAKGNTSDVDDCARRRIGRKKKEGYGHPQECPKLIRQSATLAAPALVIAAQSWQK